MDTDCEARPVVLDETIPSPTIETLPLLPNELRTLTERMNTLSDEEEWKNRADRATNDSKWRTFVSTILWSLTDLLKATPPTQAEHFIAFPDPLTAKAFANELNNNDLKLWKEAVQKGVDNKDWTDLFRLFVQPSPTGDDDHEVKRKQVASQRKWTVNGAIREDEAKNFYYLNPGTQEESKKCLDAVSRGEFLLLSGARASGKSTRLLWLNQRLEVMGYWPLYVSFEGVFFQHGTNGFWETFGTRINEAAYRSKSPKRPTTLISSWSQFLNYFSLGAWNNEKKVVLLIDELGKLYEATSVRDDCLQALRTLKQSPFYAVQSLIAAGTFGIVYLNTSPATSFSSFNVASVVQNPNFSMDETRKLFHKFAEDRGSLIDDDIVKDVWVKSNGHPGMVCLCGRTIYQNLETLVEMYPRLTISYKRWQQYPVEALYNEIALYNTFNTMVRSLSRPEASPSLFLLRSRFVGFLDEVQLMDKTDEDLANFLTSEGVLLKPNPAQPRYQMASALIDGLIRNNVIPSQFRDAPLSPLPLQLNGVQIHVLDILIESLNFFDKRLIYQASSRSYKKPKVTIRGSPNGHVPRESVYDTELVRILSN